MRKILNRKFLVLFYFSIFIYVLSFIVPSSLKDVQFFDGALRFLFSILGLPVGIFLFLSNPLYIFALYFYKKGKYWLSFILSGLSFIVAMQYYFPGRLHGPSDPIFNYSNNDGNFNFYLWVGAFMIMVIISAIQMKIHKQIKKGFWKTLPFFIFIMLALSLSYLLTFVYLHEVPKPKFNTNPKYHVVITGNIQKNKANPLTIIYEANYRSFHACNATINTLEGNDDGSPDVTIYYPVNLDRHGNYKVVIPMDAYHPGRCQWMISSIKYNTVLNKRGKKYKDPDEEWTTILYFEDPTAIDIAMRPDTNQATIICGNDGIKGCRGWLGLMANYTHQHISRQRSYHFIQNIRFVSTQRH